MSLQTELQLIFPNINNLEEEAHKKLTNTWCFVNGELAKILVFNDDSTVSIDTYIKKKTVSITTLKTWLPQTGLYPLPNGQAVFIVKMPKRQWQRSFSYDFYSIFPLHNETWNNQILPLIAATTKTNIFIDKEQNIWWWNKIIGFIKNQSTIICTNPHYKQELLDWSKTI